MAKSKENLKVKHGRETTKKLVKTARKLFAEKGYRGTSMEKVVALCNVTRGALYHHFNAKEKLFHAVFLDAFDELVNKISLQLEVYETPLEKLVVATDLFFDASCDRAFRQIVLIDAPAVLGWDAWREADETRTMLFLRTLLTELVESGVFKPMKAELLAPIVWGATNELALYITQSDDPKQARLDATEAMVDLYESLRA